MFEVGFTEIILILGLALLVLGPEKLPALAQKIGRWTGRARSMARQLRSQLEQEVTLEELAKSKPMQPARDTSAEPAASTPSDSSPAGGIDFDKHFDDYDTTPEKMHPKASDSVDTSPEAMHGQPPVEIETAEIATSPETMHGAMHGKPKDTAAT